MNYQAVSELITSSNHNVLIVGDSASEVDGFLNKLNITDYKYYDFSQIYSCSDRTLNDYAVIFIRDALNASEHIIIFNCTGWPDLNNESAVMQFARVARKSGKQLIVAVREQDMKNRRQCSGRRTFRPAAFLPDTGNYCHDFILSLFHFSNLANYDTVQERMKA